MEIDNNASPRGITKGKWRVGFSDGSGMSYIVAETPTPVGGKEIEVVVSGEPDSLGIEQGVRKIADAHLMAAAPDLYRALELVLSEYRKLLDDAIGTEAFESWREIRAARAALAKASPPPVVKRGAMLAALEVIGDLMDSVKVLDDERDTLRAARVILEGVEVVP